MKNRKKYLLFPLLLLAILASGINRQFPGKDIAGIANAAETGFIIDGMLSLSIQIVYLNYIYKKVLQWQGDSAIVDLSIQGEALISIRRRCPTVPA